MYFSNHGVNHKLQILYIYALNERLYIYKNKTKPKNVQKGPIGEMADLLFCFILPNCFFYFVFSKRRGFCFKITTFNLVPTIIFIFILFYHHYYYYLCTFFYNKKIYINNLKRLQVPERSGTFVAPNHPKKRSPTTDTTLLAHWQQSLQGGPQARTWRHKKNFPEKKNKKSPRFRGPPLTVSLTVNCRWFPLGHEGQ